MGGEVRAVLFDKDGTLFDFQETWGAFTRGLISELAGGRPDRIAALADVMGYDLERARFRSGSIVVAEAVQVVADRILPLLPGEDRAGLIARMNARTAEVRQVAAAPLVPLLGTLAGAGLALGVVTNDAEGPARAHLRAAGVLSHFGFVSGYDSGHGAKPAPGQLLAFAAATGIAPCRIAMVGDSLHDLEAAEAAGMRRVAVLTGVAEAAELAPAAEVVLDTVGDLPGWLGLGPAEARARG